METANKSREDEESKIEVSTEKWSKRSLDSQNGGTTGGSTATPSQDANITDLCRVLNKSQSAKTLDPTIYLDQFHRRHPLMGAGQQHDAHEFLVELLNDITFMDGNNQASPLTALIENTRACSQCDKVTGKFEKWDSYVCSVPVDALQKLMDCILHIGVKGKEESYAYIYCDYCRENSLHQIWSTFVDQPRVLIIHMRRFDNEGNKNSKIRHRIVKMDISAICSDSSGPVQYSLTSAILHKGSSTRAGHYTSIVKINDRWYVFDDEKVSTASTWHVKSELKRYGYVLFFKCRNVSDQKESKGIDRQMQDGESAVPNKSTPPGRDNLEHKENGINYLDEFMKQEVSL
ncbi:unnamed protein product, partial [Porites lobata]